jgi:PII-like signaling protein
MKLEGSTLRLTVFVGEVDRWHYKPVYAEIVHRANKAGLAGATALRGIVGYGASSRVHTPGPLTLSHDVPLSSSSSTAPHGLRRSCRSSMS